ncbi:unnamed protein product, partial [Didymodactylos carnosus]
RLAGFGSLQYAFLYLSTIIDNFMMGRIYSSGDTHNVLGELSQDLAQQLNAANASALVPLAEPAIRVFAGQKIGGAELAGQPGASANQISAYIESQYTVEMAVAYMQRMSVA